MESIILRPINHSTTYDENYVNRGESCFWGVFWDFLDGLVNGISYFDIESLEDMPERHMKTFGRHEEFGVLPCDCI